MQIIFYLLVAVFIYSFKNRHSKSQRLQNFFACLIAILNAAQCCVVIVKVFFPDLAIEHCVAFKMIQMISIAISPCVAHLFFNDRLKGLTKPHGCNKTRTVRAVSILVIMVSAAQVGIMCYRASMNKISCGEGALYAGAGYHVGYYYVYIGSKCLIGFSQLVIMGLILLKLVRHLRLLTSTPSIRNGTRKSNVVMKAVIKRIGCSSIVFVVSDVMLVVYIIARSTITFWHGYLASVNLTVNLISVICSHSDYQKRFFPFQRTFRGSREASPIRVNTVLKKRDEGKQ